MVRRFSVEDVRSAAGPKWFGRGQQYYEQGRVCRLQNDSNGVSAVVTGSRNYTVRLDLDGGVVADSCTCPLGHEAHWCTHAVAVALAWIHAGREAAASPPQEPDLSVFLEGQESAWLAEQLLRIADDQPAILARLQAAAGAQSAVDTARAALYTAITEYTPEPDDWSPGDGGAAWLRQAIDTLDDLVDYGYAAEVAGLAADAYALFDETHGDDGDANAERLQELSELETY